MSGLRVVSQSGLIAPEQRNILLLLLEIDNAITLGLPRPVRCAHSPTPHKFAGTRSSSSTVSPPSYTVTVPDEAEITTAVASVTVVMASAAA